MSAIIIAINDTKERIGAILGNQNGDIFESTKEALCYLEKLKREKIILPCGLGFYKNTNNEVVFYEIREIENFPIMPKKESQ